MHGKINYGNFKCMDCSMETDKLIHYSKELKLCFGCYEDRTKQETSCVNCKYYDGWLCELNYSSKAILDEVKTAKECEYFTLGEFKYSDKHLLINNEN